MEEVSKEDRPSKVHLYLVVICANIPSLSLGTCIGWTSPMMPKLKNHYDDSPLPERLTTSQMSWIFSLFGLGALGSALIAGYLADLCGRKLTSLLGSFLFAVAYIVLIFGTCIEAIYAGRIIQGFGSGFTMTVLPIYVGEISTKESRGSVGSFMMLFMTLGMLYVYTIGPYTKYVVMQVCCLAIPIISIGGFLYLPESPHYLVMKDRHDKAAKALAKIRGQSLETVQIEMLEIQKIIERSKNMTKGRMADLFLNRGNRRALIIVLGLMFFQQFSGALIIVINAHSIFIQAGTSIDPTISSIIVGSCQVVSSVTLQLVIDRCKRKTLLRCSALGMFIADFTLSKFFYMNIKGDAAHIKWIPILAVIAFQVSYRIGFGPMPFAIASEVFAPNIRAVAGPLLTMTCWGLGFVVTFAYPILDEYGTYYVFWICSVFCGLAFFFAQFVVIETKGLSLLEIQERLNA